MVLLSLAAAVSLARALGPAGRGQLAVLQSLAGLAAVLTNFAVAKAIVHRVGRRQLTLASAASDAFVLAAMSGLAGAALVLPLAILFRGRLVPGLAIALVAAAVGVATIQQVREYLSGVLLAVGQSLTYVMASAVQPLVVLVLVSLLMVLGRASVGSVTVVWIAAVVASAGVAMSMAVRAASGLGPILWRDVRALGAFGVRTYPAILALFLNLRFDQLLVRGLSSSWVLGQYAVAVAVGEVLIILPSSMLSAASGAIGAWERDQSAELVAGFCRSLTVVVATCAVGIAVVAPIALPLVFGAGFRPAAPAVIALLPGLVCYAPSATIVEYFIVQRGKASAAAIIAGASFATSTVMNLWLVPRLGAVGASVASSVSYGVMLIVAARLFRSDTGMQVGSALRPTMRDVSAVRDAVMSVARARG